MAVWWRRVWQKLLFIGEVRCCGVYKVSGGGIDG